MKITVEKSKLQQCLVNLSTVVPTKPPGENLIIDGVKLTAASNILKLTGTDLDITAQITIPAKVDQPGEVVINCKSLLELVRKLDKGPVEIEVKKTMFARITSNNFGVGLNGVSAKDFPSHNSSLGDFILELDQGELKERIRKTIFAAAKEDSRTYLNGIFLAPGEKLAVVGTDGHRLAITNLNFRGPVDWPGVIIPSKAAAELYKILGDSGPVEIGLGGNEVSFNLEVYSLTSRLLYGQYPNFNSIVPKEFTTKLIVGREDLIAALERVLVVLDKAAAKFTLREGNSLIISAIPKDRTAISEGSREDLPCRISGQDLEIHLNAKYFLDSLKVMDSEEVKIGFTGQLSPALIFEDDYKYILMPVRA